MKRPLQLQESTTLPTENTENADIKAGPAPSKRMRKSKPALSDHDFSSGEISKLKETEGLHHSGLFRLQMNELLKEIAVKHKLKQRLEEAVETFTSLLQGLPAGKEHKIIDRKWLEKKSVKVPFVEKPFAVKGTFQFFPPSSVKLTGSVALDTVVKPNVETDLILNMPQTCFQTKDYLNQRCMRKQALYLAAVSSHLCKNKRVEDLKFSYHQGNPLKPSLIVTFKGKDSKKVIFCLRAVPEPKTFKPARFHVNKNNVRPRWYFEQSGVEEEEKDDITSLPATPLYNSSMLHDICSATNDAFVEKMIMGSEGVRHGVMLLKVWLRQRSLLQGYGAFNSYLITCFVTYLLMKTKLNKLMNSYQVFRTTLVYLSKLDWTLEPPSLFEGDPDKSLPSLPEFQAASPYVFVDRTGYLNLAYMVSASVFVRVKEEAKLSLEMLDMSRPNSFVTLFMTPISYPRKFDHIFHIAIHSELLKKACNQVDKLFEKSMDFGGHQSLALQLHLLQLLSKGLERRITLIQALPTDRKHTWGISDEPFSYDDRKVLTFGLSLDAACAFSILDKGPPADSAEAKEFSEFWGEKSEMRRFKDGTIHEAVLWTSSSLQSDRRLICKSIVQHVLSRHCGISKSHINYIGGQLDSLLHLRLLRKGDAQPYGTGEEESLAVIHAFDDVNRSLRALASLPLAIHSIQGIHPVFRHSDVFPPLPASGVREASRIIRHHVVPVEDKFQPHYVPAITVICTLEGSGKWPEDKKAIDSLKSLIHVKMGAELKEKHLLSVSVSGTHVDVFKDGFVFRLKIASTRELAVLRTVKTESGMVRFRDTDQSLALDKEIVAMPLLTNLLHGVQQAHPVFSATVRLCKRWMAAQMVWDLIPEEVVELVVAYIFTSSFPYTPPASPHVGLCRFLHLLSTFNWQADPLMVNLNKEFTEEDYATIPKLMSKNRATLPSMCIVTPADKQGTKWTRSNPSEAFLQRIVILAKEALRILEFQIMSPAFGTDFKTIFRPPLGHFDLVIRLLKKANLLHHQAVDSNYEMPIGPKELGKSSHQAFPVTEFNVVRKFIVNLQVVFGDFAEFFHDPFGGDVIGLVWKPQAMERKDFKPSSFAYRKPVVDENETVGLETVKENVLDDIRVLGGGIVESVGPPQKEM